MLASGGVMPADDWPAGGALILAGLGILVSAGGGDGGISVGEEMEDALWATSRTLVQKDMIMSRFN